MNKRIVTLLLTTVMLSFTFVNANADVIFEPEDDFYERHRNECGYMGRNFYANGEDGYVTLLSEPEFGKETATIENGAILLIQYTYDYSGEVWGVGFNPGWVPMSDLILVYDNTSFFEEHEQEFTKYQGNSDILLNARRVVFWSWPGSGEITMEHVPSADNRELEGGWLTATYSYTDNDGRQWGYIPYFYAVKGQWVCLSEPSNRVIPAFNVAPEPVLKQPGNSGLAPDVIPGNSPGNDSTPGRDPAPPAEPDRKPPTDGLSLPVIILILVGVIVVVTAALIGIFWKRKKG